MHISIYLSIYLSMCVCVCVYVYHLETAGPRDLEQNIWNNRSNGMRIYILEVLDRAVVACV